jgi:hypothetical protein
LGEVLLHPLSGSALAVILIDFASFPRFFVINFFLTTPIKQFTLRGLIYVSVNTSMVIFSAVYIAIVLGFRSFYRRNFSLVVATYTVLVAITTLMMTVSTDFLLLHRWFILI